MNRLADPAAARELLERPGILWHQKFPLAEGVVTPGPSDIRQLAADGGLPDDLTGLSVLDIGTTNGGAAFLAEERGASLVVATDIVPSVTYGFTQIAQLLSSRVRFVMSSVYELPEVLAGQTFDIVIFWGVLYHLRHPLLGLDCVRRLTHGTMLLESAVGDYALPPETSHPVVLCDADPGGYGDETNWFMPSVNALTRWVERSGFEVGAVTAWPADAPSRAQLSARASTQLPRYLDFGTAHERPMSVTALDPATAYPGR